MSREALQESSLEDVTVFMPIGGRGTRALDFTGDDTPKHLKQLGNGEEILTVVLKGMQRVGFRQFVFCVGHLKDQTMKHLDSKSWIVAKDVGYDFSEEEGTLLGPEGAVLQSLDTVEPKSDHGIIIPGDVMLPWRGVGAMTRRHIERGTDFTLGVTSYVTERSGHIGRLVVENHTNKLLECLPQPTDPRTARPSTRNLTSATAFAMNIPLFVKLCSPHLEANRANLGEAPDLRDALLSLAINSPAINIEAYDTGGEVLDLGTKENYLYAKENWAQYV